MNSKKQEKKAESPAKSTTALPRISLMDVDMAQLLQNGLNKAETIDAEETKRLEEAKKKAPVKATVSS